MSEPQKSVKYSDLSDDELIALVRDGDSEAVNTLIVRYSSVISFMAQNYFLDSLTFDDWYQEGMIGFLHAIRSYSGDRGASFKTYASKCVRNRLSDCLRNSTNSKNLPLNSAVEFDEDFDIPVVSCEDTYILSEDNRDFEQILKKHLSETEKKVMISYLAGYTYAEIANSLNMTVKAVDSAICRAKNKLKKNLNISS